MKKLEDQSANGSPPSQLGVTIADDGGFVVSMEPSKQGCLLFFVGTLVLVFTPVVLWALPIMVMEFYFAGSWFALLFLVATGSVGTLVYLFFARMVLHRLFGRTTLSLKQSVLRAHDHLFGQSWGITLPQRDITEIARVHKPATADNSFESWGLRLNSSDRYWLLQQESAESTLWLARFLSDRLCIPWHDESE